MINEDHPLKFDEDLIKAYASKRKALEEEDVKDLLKCLKGYLIERMDSNETYAIHIPNLGVLHRKFNRQDLQYYSLSKEEKLIERMIVSDALNNQSIIHVKPKVDDQNREAIQDYTNNN